MDSLYLKALERFNSLGFPTKKDEHWRFADLKFWSNSKLLQHTNSFEDFKLEGAACEFFEELLKGGKFDAYLATSFGNLKVFRVGEGEKKTLRGGFLSSVNAFILEEGAELEILSQDFEESQNLKLQANCYFLAKSAKLKVNAFNKSNSPSYRRSDFFISEGAELSDVFIEAGSAQTRAERNYRILGENVKCDSAILTKSEGSITHDVRTRQVHSIGKSHSNVLLKSILGGESKLAFMGLIDVCEAAQKTETYQSCRALLLSKKAKAQASPILEIMANDVSCSHGCAVARPDSEQIFYMQSRGLSEREAQELLIGGFANEVLDRISDLEFKNAVLPRL